MCLLRENHSGNWFWLGKYFYATCAVQECFVYHFNLLTPATVYVPSWFWGEHCIHSFIDVLICSTNISSTLEPQVTWKENVNSLPFHPILFCFRILRPGFCPLFQNWYFGGHQWNFLPIPLLLLWLVFPAGLSSVDHLLPLGTICLRFILYLSGGSAQYHFLLLALFLYLKELI